MIDNLYKCALVHFNIIELAYLVETGIDGDVLWDMQRDEFDRIQALVHLALEEARRKQ